MAILVQRTILDEFLTRFKEAAAALVVGDPQDSKTNMGPVVSETHYNKVTSYLRIAEYENSTRIYGGERPDLPAPLSTGYYLQPTIYLQENPQGRICQEEISGPIVTIIPFHTEAEALEIANGTE